MRLVGKRIATTMDDFRKMVQNDYLLVDKSLFIKEFLDGTDESFLITRPRRFGKSMNLSMLQHFFAAEVDARPTKGLFDNFEIAKVDDGQFLKKHQGQYPVILMNFKDAKANGYEGTIETIRYLIQELFRQHVDLLKSDNLNDYDIKTFEEYLQGASERNLQFSLKFLCEILYKVHKKEVIILIDEYDSPLTAAYQYDFVEELSNFMRNMLSSIFKTNSYLKKGLMTGILRVSKNNMLSGLNNLKIYTLFDDLYSQYFGFTEEEVIALMQYTSATETLDSVRAYYNGYKIGNSVLYNPWSIMHFLNDNQLAPYWVMTSNDKLLRDILVESNDGTKEKMNDLMQGKAIEDEIDINLRYEDLVEKPFALWTLLLFCGYLKVEKSGLLEIGTKYACRLRIPNKEITRLYNGVFSDWLSEQMGKKQYTNFLKSLVSGDVEQFTQTLGQFLLHSLSVRDVNGDSSASERFYHGFFAGLTASLQEYFSYTSNQESGLGYYDVGLVPYDKNNPVGIVLEFKHCKREDDGKSQAQIALEQIDKMKYETAFARHPQIKQLLKIGLAFCDKSVVSAYKITELSSKQDGDIQMAEIEATE